MVLFFFNISWFVVEDILCYYKFHGLSSYFNIHDKFFTVSNATNCFYGLFFPSTLCVEEHFFYYEARGQDVLFYYFNSHHQFFTVSKTSDSFYNLFPFNSSRMITSKRGIFRYQVRSPDVLFFFYFNTHHLCVQCVLIIFNLWL